MSDGDVGDDVRIPAEAARRPLTLDEVTSWPTVVKCMGRTYSASAADGEVFIADSTDITRSFLLGTAVRSGDTWDVVGVRGDHVVSTDDLLAATSALREASSAPWAELAR